MIEAQSASLVYEDYGKQVHACKDIDLEIKSGEFVGILGPSGSGKSSLLYLLCGLKDPSHGKILYQGKDIGALREDERSELRLLKFGFVFQYPYLLGYLTALENVIISHPTLNKEQASETESEALELLVRLGLKEKAHRYPHELSGGEKQRICVARALLGGREVIFADEPTANLDHVNGESVVETLVQNRGNGALVMVTHDPTMLKSATRIITISDGEIISA